jgi:hypothetical protein
MRARAAPSFETRAAPAPQDEAAQRIPSALAARRRTVRRNPISRYQTAHTYSFPRRIFAPGVCIVASLTPKSRGGRSAEKRSGACEAPAGRIMTRYARRLRGALRPMTRDARLSALHRGGFSPGAALPSPALSSGSVQRAPRSQVVVPGGRLPGPPGASGCEPPPQDATPRSAFRIVSRRRPR